MSADRWGICPKCNKQYYGELERGNNLREDYEVWTNAQGIFEIIYRCSCYKCGFSFKYNYEQNLLESSNATTK